MWSSSIPSGIVAATMFYSLLCASFWHKNGNLPVVMVLILYSNFVIPEEAKNNSSN